MKLTLLPGLQAKHNAVRLGSLFLKVLLFAPLSLLSQSRPVAKATIPFSFTVNGHTLPAGDYTLFRENGNILSLRTARGTVGSMVVYPDTSATTQETGKLVFRTYGDGFYLASIWSAGSRDGLRLVTSKREKQEIAQRKTAASNIMVASSGQAAATN